MELVNKTLNKSNNENKISIQGNPNVVRDIKRPILIPFVCYSISSTYDLIHL